MKKSLNTKLVLIFLAAVAVGALMLSLGLKHTLDARLYYNADYFVEFFSRLDPELHRLYTVHERLDLVFLLVYGLFLYWGLQKLFGMQSGWRWLAPVPVLFDLFETSVILLCLGGGVAPQNFSWLGVITFLKWVSGFIILAVALLRALLVAVRTARG